MKNVFIKWNMFVILFLSLTCNVWADEIIVNEDNASTYIPTNIINGGFDECPWVSFKIDDVTYSKSTLDSYTFSNFLDGTEVDLIYNGTNGGWNTTTNVIYDDGKLFDWTKKLNGVVVSHAINATYNGSLQTGSNYSFIEMNGHEAAVFYQDLNTIGGDVIRWTLNHGIRPTPEAPYQQNISVEIGAPNRKDGKIVTAHGTGDDLYTEEFENGSIVKFSKTDKCEDLKEGEEVYYIVSANTLLKGNVGPRTENMDSDALTISEHNVKCNQMLGKTNEYKVYSSWGNIIDFLTNRYIYLFVILLPTIALCVYEVYLLKNRNSKSE